MCFAINFTFANQKGHFSKKSNNSRSARVCSFLRRHVKDLCHIFLEQCNSDWRIRCFHFLGFVNSGQAISFEKVLLG